MQEPVVMMMEDVATGISSSLAAAYSAPMPMPTPMPALATANVARKTRRRALYNKPELDRSRILDAGPHMVYHLAQPNVVYFLHEKRLEEQLREQDCLSMPTMWLDDHTLLMPLHHLQRIFGSTSSCVQYGSFPPELVTIKRFKMSSSTKGSSGRDYVAITRADLVRWYEFAASASAPLSHDAGADSASLGALANVKVPRLYTHGPHRELGCAEWLRKCCLVIECFERRGRLAAQEPVALGYRLCKRIPFLAPFSDADVRPMLALPAATTEEDEADEENDDYEADGGEYQEEDERSMQQIHPKPDAPMTPAELAAAQALSSMFS
jgi:hypothetical protein